MDIDWVTKVWKNRKLVEFKDVATGSAVQFNLGWSPGRRDRTLPSRTSGWMKRAGSLPPIYSDGVMSAISSSVGEPVGLIMWSILILVVVLWRLLVLLWSCH